MEHPTIALPGNRSARLVPADEAGAFRLILDEPSIRDRLRGIGCTPDEADAAEHLVHAWSTCGAELRSRSAFGAATGGGGCIEERINERAYRQYARAMQAMRPDHAVVAAVVIDGQPRTLRGYGQG